MSVFHIIHIGNPSAFGLDEYSQLQGNNF